jgi:hypothetical protein
MYNVWRIDGEDKSEVLWDGPLSAEDAEKVRFCRQRDNDVERRETGKGEATFVVVMEGMEPSDTRREILGHHPAPGADNGD